MSTDAPDQLELSIEQPTYLDVLNKYRDHDPAHVLLPEKEAALLAEQEPKTLEGWRHQGKELPFVKLGRKVRYRLSDVLEYRSRVFSSSREAQIRDRSAGRAR